MKGFFAVCCFMLSAALAHAEVYKWVDENGDVHFSDNKPDTQAEPQEIDLKINTYTNVEVDNSLFDVGQNVIMYATSWCSYCKKARSYFQKNNIPFTEYDIEKDKAAKRRYDQLGAKGVPVILVGNKRMNGFSEQRFEKLYK